MALTLEERFRRVLEHEVRNPDRQDLALAVEMIVTCPEKTAHNGRYQRLLQTVIKDCLTGGEQFGRWKIAEDGTVEVGFDPDLTPTERMRRLIMRRYQHRLETFDILSGSLTAEQVANAIEVLDVLKDCAEERGDDFYQEWTISKNGKIRWLD